jgi:hypothetical protein
VDEVVDHFTSLGASVEELVTRTESVQFALPVELQSDLKERPASN